MCRLRLKVSELQADHINGRESFKDPLDADYIENMTLRCRRCNVIRRPSHEFGGLTFLTATRAHVDNAGDLPAHARRLH